MAKKGWALVEAGGVWAPGMALPPTSWVASGK